MSIDFSPWPAHLARRYREKGYWNGTTLPALLERGLRQAEGPAILCGERVFSYADMHTLSDRLAAALKKRGIRRYDTALVQLPNIAEFYIVFFALMKLGVVPVNALFSHKQHELSAYAKQVRPRLLIASATHPLFGCRTFLAQLLAEMDSINTVLLHNGTSPEEDLQACLNEESDQTFVPSSTNPDEVAFFQLSGGSTGTPKLIPRTHDDYGYSVRASAKICDISARTRALVALPAGHNYVLSSPGALGVFYSGGTVALAPSPEPSTCFSLIERHALTMASLVPSAVSLWLEHAVGRRDALRSLTLLQVGGARFAESIARRVPPELGCRLQQVFGMAEGLVCYTRLDDPKERVFATQGRPISIDDEIHVLDQDGNPVGSGEPGLLFVRGPYTFRGYYQSAEHNASAFDSNGFYRSGDIVVRDEDGMIRVVGREKDQINRGGEKIAAEEIEVLLLRHPDVMQAALISMADARLGEKSCAFICTPEDAPPPSSRDLRRFLRAQGIADYKLPDRFVTIERMPLTAVGKTDKNILRTRLAEMQAHTP